MVATLRVEPMHLYSEPVVLNAVLPHATSTSKIGLIPEVAGLGKWRVVLLMFL